jgi:DNA mismatch repair protein MutS
MQTRAAAPEKPPPPAAPGFRSILFEHGGGAAVARGKPPACFGDLNLDRVVEAIVAGREEYDLKPFFHAPLGDRSAVEYRHEVMRELEAEDVSRCVERFARRMRTVRERLALAREARHERQGEAWHLEAASTYCEAVAGLTGDLAPLELESRGLRGFRELMERHVGGEGFGSLKADAERLKARLASVRYRLEIKGNRIQVSHCEDELDYSEEVGRAFEKFRQGAVKDYRVKFASEAEMNHVEAAVLDLVARLFPDVFEELSGFRRRHDGFAEETVLAFDREVQFYLAYLDYVEGFAKGGLSFCYPRVSEGSKQVAATEAFDVALADRLGGEGEKVVCNDWRLDDPERVFVVSGPNQGGKTTFARTFGQLHYLASIGCQVPGREARLFLCDRVFTHFERREDATSLSGKLEDDLERVHEILGRATPRSVLVMNESFGSTTLSDARFLGAEILERIVAMEALCVYVTFVDELASLGPSVVSMMSTVDPDDPAVRTFEVVRKPADGRAYAAAIARKYGLSSEDVQARIAR